MNLFTVAREAKKVICELDMVVINRDIPEHGLVQGDIGVMTLTLDDVRTIKNDEILHVRELNSA